MLFVCEQSTHPSWDFGVLTDTSFSRNCWNMVNQCSEGHGDRGLTGVFEGLTLIGSEPKTAPLQFSAATALSACNRDIQISILQRQKLLLHHI
jgi:hypothetical protein